MKIVICCEKAPGASGPFSQAMEAGGVVYVSGQLPIDAATGQMAEGIEGQTRQSLENIKYILEEAGLTMDDIVKTTAERYIFPHFLARRDDLIFFIGTICFFPSQVFFYKGAGLFQILLFNQKFFFVFHKSLLALSEEIPSPERVLPAG